jgi:uncharacterized membrane protein YoaK (UPF0700 family)
MLACGLVILLLLLLFFFFLLLLLRLLRRRSQQAASPPSLFVQSLVCVCAWVRAPRLGARLEKMANVACVGTRYSLYY